MQFLITLILSAALIVIPNVISALKESSYKYRWWTVASAAIGIILSICTSYSAHHDAIRSADTAKYKDSLYTDLLNQNLKSARKIIDSLDTAVNHTRGIILQNNDILLKQKNSIVLLNKNLSATDRTQKSVIVSGNNLLLSLNKAEKNINDNVTGGDGYVTIEIGTRGMNAILLAKNPTRFALSKVSITVKDISGEIECIERNLNNVGVLADCEYNFTVGVPEVNIYRYSELSLEDLNYKVDTSGIKKYVSIEVDLPNKRYREQLRYQQTRTGGRYRYRLIKLVNGQWTPYLWSKDFDRLADTKDFDGNFYFEIKPKTQ